ncbi:hypothetical protein QAD02_002271 [Eretmocerus hayati]|uniref:Uncharacterized protein n=1 Tax=Eretmocerus hayati TaxID=131215 RepID=A0ACC2NIT9_9HYME|nr:hypothetical protein QAD02_002271 [Eretmocerus hayati]
MLMCLQDREQDCTDFIQKVEVTDDCKFVQPGEVLTGHLTGRFGDSNDDPNLNISDQMKIHQGQDNTSVLDGNLREDTKRGIVKIEMEELSDLMKREKICTSHPITHDALMTDTVPVDIITPSCVSKQEEIDGDKVNDVFAMKNSSQHIKIEPSGESDDNDDFKVQVPNMDVEGDTVKIDSKASSLDTVGGDESSITKLSFNRTIRTYSKRHNNALDSEIETEFVGENADYRAWKKSILLVHNRLATHKYSSIFLKPITEDQAPGYHSIIFRPMDLSTIKKNIENGTIRSTPRFQRDVMLMFQNAIIYNGHNTIVHKRTLEMREECLQHMQVMALILGCEQPFIRLRLNIPFNIDRF